MNRRTRAGLFLVAVTLLGSQAPTASAGVIINGDFSVVGIAVEPFASWSTDTDISGFIAPLNDGGVASFTTTGFFDAPVHLYQTFSLPNDAVALSFEYRLSTGAGGLDAPFAANDSFQASLFRAFDFEAQFPISSGVLDAFYLLDASDFEDFSTGVSTAVLADDWTRVTLDVTSLAAGDYIIDFLLLGDDDGLTTNVLLDNVIVTYSPKVVPEPATLVIWTTIATVLLPLRRRSRYSAAHR